MHSSLLRICSAVLCLLIAPFASGASSTNKAKTAEPPAKVKSSARIDVNTADAATLETLPGIGPVTARAIIEARPFAKVDDLASVPGIGPAKLAELRDHVRVSHVPAGTKAAKGKAGAESKDAERARTTKTERTERATSPASAREPAPAMTKRDRPLEPTGYPSTTRRAPDASPSSAALVNLNTATKEQLESLPEIGPVKAQAIIDARPFSSIEDVMRVKGIKEGTFNVIKDRITVR